MKTEDGKNIIQGPWKKGRKVKLPDLEEVDKISEDLYFADELTQSLLVGMIHTMGENGFDVNGKPFVHSMGFLIEAVRSTVYKELNLVHPLTKLMEDLTDMESEKDELSSKLNEHRLSVVYDIVSWELDGDDPEVS